MSPSSSHPLQNVLAIAGEVILGKAHALRLAFTCLLARGHLLIEDVPGVGKTTLSHVIAKLLGLEYQRIQFTSDLLPADILGVSIYQRESGRFHFHPGPVFSQLILADEINRATPKAQSALLEAMEEHQVTVEGETRPLPKPFFVIATQNPAHQIGTFPLPESQLDRFLMRIELGYPDRAAERALLAGTERRTLVEAMQPRVSGDELMKWQVEAGNIHVANALLDYIQALAEYTRYNGDLVSGLSPRATLGLLAAARAWALLEGRDHVLPEDVQAVLPAICGHRLRSRTGALPPEELSRQLIEAVPLP